ncbi:MAG: sugar phosphate isomerase [Microbacterium sp. SCN 71-21]|nr:MAG: sugar phosphate isomerase [Microbacterium sp. SCN 71-21]
MMFGLSTYAFFWQLSDRVSRPMTLEEAFVATKESGVDLFQICDYAPLDTWDDARVADAAASARDLGLTIELGTKGVDAATLRRYLHLADLFGATLVRSMLYSPTTRPDSTAQAIAWLGETLPEYESAGVTLALETYEQVATRDLVAVVEGAESPVIGVCLDPANVVARLETPGDCIAVAAPHVVNVHVKDFAFARQDGWVGFTYSGARMGEGLHNYPDLLRAVRPRERGINEIVEHWLPWQGDEESTTRTERDWTRTTLDYLRSTL